MKVLTVKIFVLFIHTYITVDNKIIINRMNENVNKQYLGRNRLL